MSNHKDLAARLRKDAEKYLRQYERDDAPEITALIARDVADLQRIAAVIETGDMRRACRHAAKLDTIVRDSISDPVWRALSGDAVFGHEDVS